ncbi:Protein RADIALIS-like 3 [Morella rubra]|uniref:Protein RADIALIS-like 3 n=1 Tax=Morella rubra TaxID=262757 RepID=A0A6A1USB9_9ROSI|nr:Protein RADIALIS-like 3 [Morella rubra]
MDDFPKFLCGWSWEENKLFEQALAVVDEQDPDRWEVVAAMVGGKKSAEDVQKHYVILLEDLQVIESGELDNKLGEAQPCVHVESAQSICWSDEDDKLERKEIPRFALVFKGIIHFFPLVFGLWSIIFSPYVKGKIEVLRMHSFLDHRLFQKL